MCLIMMQQAIELKNENEIPDQVLADIIGVYRYGKIEQIKDLPNNFICDRNGKHWTTWNKVIEMREKQA